MEWQDEGVIIGLLPHGETSLIVELITQRHGRHKGLVKGGRRPARLPHLQPGNRVAAHWQARLSEHMGLYRLETTDFAAAALMRNAVSLYALQNITEHLRLLPERDPHPDIYEALPLLFAHFDTPLLAGELFMRFELRLLAELGFGLDLTHCAATGKRAAALFSRVLGVNVPESDGDTQQIIIGETGKETLSPAEKTSYDAELIYVSPKSGRAVSRSGGLPWKDKLLPLPPFLLDLRRRAADFAELEQAHRLTGFFLQRNIWQPRGLASPPFRAAFLRALKEAVLRH